MTQAMTQARNVSIVGGGIAGLASALALARAGNRVSLHERAAHFDHVGAGLQLGPNAVRALEILGAWEAVSPATYAPPAILIRSAESGRVLKRVHLGRDFTARFGQPYRVAHRADLHGGLLETVRASKAITLHMASEVSALELAKDMPVVAADGIWSKTREALFPGVNVIKRSDHIFRALLPFPHAASAELECVNLWLYPQGHVVHYPVSGGKKLNVVAVTQGERPWQFFSTASQGLREVLAMARDWLDWPAAHLPSLPAWHKDNIALIGDAAHGTLPYLAQGAAMALEDACVLGECGTDFAAYEARRRARCQKLHQETLNARDIYHMGKLGSVARNFALTVMPERRFLSNLEWIYGWR
ncbi:MAG: FAD-dependent monooxygenase [Alphaproteobacteria bacterium]|nr:FAD-dependent monooxygenase [Alphaproteobacteria bacterium]